MLLGRDRRVVGLILSVLVLAFGFCILDCDEDGHLGLGPCLVMLATSLSVTLFARLPLTGLASAECFDAGLAFSTQVPVPPPKLALA